MFKKNRKYGLQDLLSLWSASEAGLANCFFKTQLRLLRKGNATWHGQHPAGSKLAGEVRSIHILIVEDYEGFRQFVCRLLQQSGSFQISQASDGMEALQKFRELNPDLILLDIGLQQLNGLDVARKLGSASKVLFLSQEYSSDIVDEALGHGAGYVYKLDVQSELLPAIEAILQGKRYVSSSLESHFAICRKQKSQAMRTE